MKLNKFMWPRNIIVASSLGSIFGGNVFAFAETTSKVWASLRYPDSSSYRSGYQRLLFVRVWIPETKSG